MQSTEVPPARGDDCFSTHTHTLALSSHTLTHTQAHSHTIPAVRSFPQYRDRAARGGQKLAHLHYRHPPFRSAHQGQGHSFRGPEAPGAAVPWERSCPLADDRRGRAAHQACSLVPVWPRRKPREAGYWRRWRGPSSAGQIHIVLLAVTEAMQVAVPSAA